MAVPSLDWRSVTDSRSPQFFVKGTRIAVAFYCQHRFGIYEVRGSANRDGSFDDYYVVTDAETVTLEQVKEGVSPKAVFLSDGLDLPAAIAYCDAANVSK